MQCLNCRYPLEQLKNRRCPECGRDFDPSDPSTYRSPWFKDWLFRHRILIAMIVILITVSLLIAFLQPSMRAAH